MSRILLTYANANLSATTAVQLLSPDGATGSPVFTGLDGALRRLKITCHGNPVWLKLTSGAVAAATKGTGGEKLVTPSAPEVINLSRDFDGASIIANATTCLVSVSLVDGED